MAQSDYDSAVLALSGVTRYFPLSEPSGSSFTDSKGVANGSWLGTTCAGGTTGPDGTAKAAKSDGSSGRVGVIPQFAIPTVHTVFYWLRLDSQVGGDGMAFEWIDNVGGTNYVQHDMGLSSTEADFSVRYSPAATRTNRRVTSKSTVFVTGQWVFVAITEDSSLSSNEINALIDGVSLGTRDFNSNEPANNGASQYGAILGRCRDGSTAALPLNAAICGFGIANRVLTGAEILSLRKAMFMGTVTGEPPSTPSPVHSTSITVPAGVAGKWDDSAAYAPRICKNLDGTAHQDGSGRYYVYYTAYGATAGVNRDRVGLLRTTDWITFERVSTDSPVLGWGPSGTYDESGTVWDGTDVAATTVLYDGSQFIMYFEGNRFSNAHGDQVEIGVATSSDGITWTKDAGNPVLLRGAAGTKDAGDLYNFIVIKDGSTWKAWYCGHDGSGNYGVMYATASAYNGTWTKSSTSWVYKPPWNAAPSHVWKDGSTYYAALDNFDDLASVRLLKSADGITWTDQRQWFAVVPGAWDAGRVYWTDRALTGNTWRTVYTGTDAGPTTFGIGVTSQAGEPPLRPGRAHRGLVMRGTRRRR